LPAYRRAGAQFSLLEYVRGVATPRVILRRDLVLDPSRKALSADLYLPSGPGPHPLVVVIHGGSWRGGDKGQAPAVSRVLAGEGIAVADVRYRLAPGDRFPAAVADVKCALGRLRERAADLGLDGRAVLLGRSAGGEIALVAAYSAGDARIAPSCAVQDAPVTGVAALYAPTDLAWAYHHPVRPDVVHGPESLELYLGGSPEAVPDAYRLGTPQSWLDRPVPPTLLVHGTGDRLVSFEHAPRLERALVHARADVTLVAVPFAEHAFDVRSGGVGEQLTRHVLLDWLRRLYGARS
jgi:acetyl esterase/lipase